MTQSKLDLAIQKRNLVLGRLDRLVRKVDSIAVDALPDLSILTIYQTGITDCWNEFLIIQEEIELMVSTKEADVIQTEANKRIEVEDNYFGLASKIATLISQKEEAIQAAKPPPTVIHQTAPPQPPPLQVKLPELSLPIFHGNLADWPSFIDLFKASVHNRNNLTNAQKLQYLKGALRGEALSLINTLTITDANYCIAGEILESRYDDAPAIKEAALNRIRFLPNIPTESSSHLLSLADSVNESIRVLKHYKAKVEEWDFFLVVLLKEKLDQETRQRWEEQASIFRANVANKDKDLTVTIFCEFLISRAKILQVSSAPSSKPAQKSVSRPSTAKSHHVSTEPRRSTGRCLCCSGEFHKLFQCSKFVRQMSVTERSALIREKGLCSNCFGRHPTAECKSSFTCKECNKKHNTLLHFTQRATSSAGINSSPESQCIRALLATAIVNAKDLLGRWGAFRVFLDMGSQPNLISEDCARRLGLKLKDASLNLSGIVTTKAKSHKYTEVTIQSRADPSFTLKFNAFVVPRVTSDLPTIPCNRKPWTFLEDLELADPKFHIPDKIDIMLNITAVAKILLPGKREGGEGAPTALATSLGWVVVGDYKEENFPPCQPYPATSAAVHTSLDDQLAKFWELEQVPSVSVQSQEHQRCKDHFDSTYTRTKEGKFIVRLPFKPNPPELGESYLIALRRFHSLESRFKREPKVLEEYKKFMQEYLSLGHMEMIPSHQIDHRPNFYIPHHPIFRECSTTTKFRVVFDGSCKTTSKVSLNQALMVGPTIQSDLFSILIRFRSYLVALTGDLEKMYRQILIHPTDRDFQRILWRDSPNSPLNHFRLKTVTYGTSSAPYLAIQCLQKLAELEESTHPEASSVAGQDFYVDDFISGSDSEEGAIKLYHEMSQLMRKGGFSLRKWASSSLTVLQSIPKDLRMNKEEITFDDNSTIKTLGIHWKTITDSFIFLVSDYQEITCTKRVILSDVSKVFDPLGWIAPITIRAKILLQTLWKGNFGWDEPLPSYIVHHWNLYRRNLHEVQNLQIPRCIISPTAIIYHLHCFSDASEKAYAACIYLWTQDVDGRRRCHLIASKTKVAPLNPQISLPRLELCSAALLCRLYTAVSSLIRLPIQQVFAWSDSTVALAWISCPSFHWKTFVSNRTAKIQQTIPSSQWNHVRSADNPADCASRGVDPSFVITNPLWLNGPSWLTSGVIPFNSEKSFSSPIAESERKKEAHCHNAILIAEELFLRFSSFTHLIRIAAWILRFASNSRKRPQVRGTLTVKELEAAIRTLVRIIQSNHFPSEISSVRRSIPLPKKSPLIKLSPILDDEGILRVGGRLQNSHLSYSRKHPIILPAKHPFVRLLISYYHLTHLHCGPTLLISAIQERYWIIGIRVQARHHIQRCITCFKLKSQASQQLMGNLPAPRVTVSRVVSTCGTDYAGPLMIKDRKGRGARVTKAYIVLFVCFSTHAIHLEVASDLSTETFLAAFRRFSATRGKPAHVYSDCGTNFQGAWKELQRMLNSPQRHQDVSTALSNDGIQWHVNPPGSPHFGGLWEAGVKSVKHHLRRTIGVSNLTYEELLTVLKQIEACLNSRPLTYQSSNVDDLEPLTPGHFLIGSSLTSLPDETLLGTPTNRLSRWQQMQALLQGFWKRWQSEYLSRLQTRPKWWNPKTIRVGDLVLLKEPQQPLHWELARILELHPGDDGVSRVATIKTTSSIKKRPINKLCILPLDHD